MSSAKDILMARAQALVDQYGDNIPPEEFKTFALSIGIQPMATPPDSIFYYDPSKKQQARLPAYDPDTLYEEMEREYRRETECYHRNNAFECTYCPSTQVWIDF